ncbi:MAG: ParB/RepB/Spo0J family partition protein [Clostridiales bacterium]|jgi:ParB-like partition proteins|nr:ParB/RepB/Spo0J family partition protein [Clostridiales bacterium]
MNEQVVNLSIDDIIPNRFQPREVFRDQALDELALSIKEHGVIQPIIVRQIVNNKYEIIAGERRYKASTIAGKTTIPAIVRNLDDKETSKQALLENIQRQDLTPIEEARTYQTILSLDNITQEELAKTMGKSQSAISNKLRLLTLPEEVQEALLNSEISERHARSLLTVQDIEKQKSLLQEVIKNKIPVRILDEMIKKENEGNNMNENVNNPNITTPVVNNTLNPGFLYDGNMNQPVSQENLNNGTSVNLTSMVSESMNMNQPLNTEAVNTSQVGPFTPVNTNVIEKSNTNPSLVSQNNNNLPTEEKPVIENQITPSVEVQKVTNENVTTTEANNLVANIPMPLETSKPEEAKKIEESTQQVVESEENANTQKLNINTEEINKEINKIMNDSETKEAENNSTEDSSSFDPNRFKKVDFNSEIKQTISGEEVIGEGLLAGKPVTEEKELESTQENIVGKIDPIKVPAYTLNNNNSQTEIPSTELVMNEEVKNDVEPAPIVENNTNNIPITNMSNGQVLISQTGGMVLPTNQELGSTNNVSTEPNENIKSLINSQDLKLALIGIGNVINNLKARGIEVKEVRKTYADHLELTLEIKKN